MKVTRDVIYDLLPAYFAGEATSDSRALVDEFFATDPDFKRMAERFATLARDGRRADADERHVFDRARARAEHRHRARASGLAFGLGAVFALAIAALSAEGLQFGHPGVIIAIVFGAVAIGSWASSHRRNDAPA